MLSFYCSSVSHAVEFNLCYQHQSTIGPVTFLHINICFCCSCCVRGHSFIHSCGIRIGKNSICLRIFCDEKWFSPSSEMVMMMCQKIYLFFVFTKTFDAFHFGRCGFSDDYFFFLSLHSASLSCRPICSHNSIPSFTPSHLSRTSMLSEGTKFSRVKCHVNLYSFFHTLYTMCV